MKEQQSIWIRRWWKFSIKTFQNFLQSESILAMRKFFAASLYRRLLLGFIVVGVLPFAMLYGYLRIYGEKKIAQNIIKTEYIRLQTRVSAIDKVLHSLQKELLFLSRLDIIDDVISEDVDKRLARILTQKKNDLGQDLEFIIVDKKMKIVASSASKEIKGTYAHATALKDAMAKRHDFFQKNKKLFFFTPLSASFDRSKRIGTMILEYNLQNLTQFLPHQSGKWAFLIDTGANRQIGSAKHVHLHFKSQTGYMTTNEFLIVYKALASRFLRGWYYVSLFDKSKAFAFLNDFMEVMRIVFVIGILLVFAVAFVSAKKIVQPLKKLTHGVEEITQTKNYQKQIQLDAEDEIGTLAKAFNALLEVTNQALEQLAHENRMRLKRFVQLIEIFNTIIQTKTEKECVETSIKEIEKLTGEPIIRFDAKESEGVPILVTDFEHDKKVPYGAIVVKKERLAPNEWRFYTSIAMMIALQLDRIRLIEKTEAASRAKSAFIANMSHELRTPLNAIIGFTQYLIAYEDLNHEQQEIIANIEKSATYLMEMINGILDIAKIEAGKMQTHIAQLELVALLDDAVTMIRPLAEQKGLQLYFEKPAEPIKIQSDAKMIKQMVINLLSNAIKFTEKGAVTLEVRPSDRKVSIIVSDTGIGIAQEDLKKLFNDFTQLDSSMQKRFKGTGLGLSLSRKLAHLLGGDLTLHSEGLGRGSQAMLTLPLKS